MSVTLDESEIVKSYKNAIDQRRQIMILAQLNACDKEIIIDILKQHDIVMNSDTKKKEKENMHMSDIRKFSPKKKWTVEEDIRLLQDINAGKLYREISETMDRSERAIAQHMMSSGWKREDAEKILEELFKRISQQEQPKVNPTEIPAPAQKQPAAKVKRESPARKLEIRPEFHPGFDHTHYMRQLKQLSKSVDIDAVINNFSITTTAIISKVRSMKKIADECANDIDEVRFGRLLQLIDDLNDLIDDWKGSSK